MSDMNRGLEQAIAMQLVSSLEQYEEQCAEMVRTWLDMETYAEVSALVDEMRPRCASLPRLSVAWMAFLISHSELVFCLWRAGAGSSGKPEVQACLLQHAAAVRSLRQYCVRLAQGELGGQALPFPRGNVPPGGGASGPVKEGPWQH